MRGDAQLDQRAFGGVMAARQVHPFRRCVGRSRQSESSLLQPRPYRFGDIDSNAVNGYNCGMAVLTIRSLPESVHSRLRVRASRNGRSMEAEVRSILAGAVNAPSPVDVKDAVAQMQEWIAKNRKKLKELKGKPRGTSLPDSVDAFLRDRRRSAIREVVKDGHHPREVFRRDYARIAAEAGWTTAYIDLLVKKKTS